MNSAQKIAIVRFSAIGDVALWVPVVQKVLATYPTLQIVFFTKKNTAFLLQNIERCSVEIIDTEVHKSIFSIYQMAKIFNQKYNFTAVVDGHRVIRSWLFTKFLKATLKSFITKGRTEKNKIISSKKITTLQQTTHRYARALAKIGLPIELQWHLPSINISSSDKTNAVLWLAADKKPLIGFAPFAKHAAKMLPAAQLQKLIQLLANKNATIILFGGGEAEVQQFKIWEQQFSNCKSAHALPFATQVALMSSLAVMVCMDSANMHLTALQGIPTVSVWGATHPAFGFGPVGNSHTIIQLPNNQLPCQPCSVFGNVPCSNKQQPYACMNLLNMEAVMNKVLL